MYSLRLRAAARALAVVSVLAAAACYTEDDAVAPAAAVLTLDTPGPVDLGLREVGGASPSRVLTVRNTGLAATGTLEVVYDAGSTAGLTRSTNSTGSCGGHSLLPGGQCTIIVTSGGAGSGPQSGTLRLTDAGDPLFTIPVTGRIRSALTVAFPPSGGHGSVAVVPTAAVHACVVATNCSLTAQGAVCTGTCSLSIDSATVTLVATPDASSTFLGFVNDPSGRPVCTGNVAGSCTLALVDLNGVSVRFGAR